jgi:hypothetical protein
MALHSSKNLENEREKAKAEEIKADFKIFASDSDYHVLQGHGLTRKQLE